MPHFIIDCSENVLTIKPVEEILKEVHDTAELTGLFAKGDIKVRIRTFKHYTVGNTKADFIHVFANIMEGRTTEQKANLSAAIVKKLKSLFTDVPVISINIREFEKATYCNRKMVWMEYVKKHSPAPYKVYTGTSRPKTMDAFKGHILVHKFAWVYDLTITVKTIYI